MFGLYIYIYIYIYIKIVLLKMLLIFFIFFIIYKDWSFEISEIWKQTQKFFKPINMYKWYV